MKTRNLKTTHALLIASLSCLTAAQGAVILGGFDGTNALNAPKQDASAVGNVTITATTNASFNAAIGLQGTNSPLWGTTAFTPAADTVSNAGVGYVNDAGMSYTFVITNTGTTDLGLETLHWRSKRDTTTSAANVTIAYASGDLTDADGTNSGSLSLGSTGAIGFDSSLSFLTDSTLAPTESATFTWTTSTEGTTRIRVDNFAISGSVVAAIPEPSSAALLGLGGLALILRRRK
jgi:hypothetical protein